MTTFAEYLVAASSLSSGTVWDLITHPRTGGAGTTVVDALTMTLPDPHMMTIDDPQITAVFPASTLTIAASNPITLSSLSDEIIIEVSP